MTTRVITAWAALLMASAFVVAVTAGDARQADANTQAGLNPPQRALLNRYCVTCHNDRLKTGLLTLEHVDVTNVSGDPEIWEKVTRKLRARAMPPAGMPRPDNAAYESLVSYFEGALDADARAHPNPGRPAAVHRLNRTEYTNAIKDLLGVDLAQLDVNGPPLLPSDDAGYGFDNIGDALSLSPLLLERYLTAAKKISRFVFGDADVKPVVATYTVPGDLLQDGRMSDDLPFGSRGGVAIQHAFPVDGEYSIGVRLQKNVYEYIRGIATKNQLEIRIDRERVGGFTIGGERVGKGPGAISSENTARGGDPAQDDYERYADKNLDIRVRVKAGSHVVGVYFVGGFPAAEGVRLGRATGFALATEKGGPIGVGSVTVGGPYAVGAVRNTPSRQRVLTCTPTTRDDETKCSRQILTLLARRAYRRPPTSDEISVLLTFFDKGRRQHDFDSGIQLALERLLVDPNFLLRVERDPADARPATTYAVSDIELASRLSFFLWSSIPDDRLIELASRGRLHEEAVLEEQVRRMLADPRAESLVTNFAAQWLWVRNVPLRHPNPDIYFDFDENLSRAFQREAELFVGAIFWEDRNVIELLTGNFTFVDERLARHYGIPNVYGDRFRRVMLPDDSPRRGVLGKGAVLMTTSQSNRTSPVVRGRWVLENLLAAQPPPPPPNVPALAEIDGGSQPKSMRERMQEHRTNAVCAACHAQMDPLGLALENFDAIGAWRTSDGGAPLDVSGKLPDGTSFEGPAGLRLLLVSRSDDFVRALTEKLMTYALGRGVEYYDAPAVRKIVRDAAVQDYRWSSIVLGIVKSSPFRLRRSAS